jgi:hypothetical protein
VTGTPSSQYNRAQHAAAASLLPPGAAEHSLFAPQAVRSSARRFRDPYDVTWWVDLVRAGVESDFVPPRRVQAVTLRFQNSISAHSRYLHPIPPDWRECDEIALWRYSQQATP